MGVHRVSKDPMRTFEMEWKFVICTRRGQGVWIREKRLSVG